MSSNVKILVGSHTSDNGSGISDILTGKGFSVRGCAPDGAAILESINSFEPDVIVCEALMPNADAVEIIRRVSAEGRKPFRFLPYQRAGAFRPVD